MISVARHMKFRFWTVRGCALLLMVAAAVSLSSCKTKDTTAPENVTGLTAVAGDTQVGLAWVNPTDTDLAGVRIQRKLDGYPASTTDGDTVLEANATSFNDSGLTNGKRYFYTVYAYDGAGNYASGVQAVALPTSSTAQALVLDGYQGVHTALADTALPANQTAELAALLDQSEEIYRAGDACGAAGVLRDYETAAQSDRGSATGIIIEGRFERLYNLGRRLRYDMRVLSQPCPGEERVGLPAVAVVDEQVNDNTQLGAAFDFGEPIVQTVETAGEVFTQVDVPGADTSTGQPGYPAVPILRRLVAVPDKAEIASEIILQGGKTVGMNLLPFQFQPVDSARNPSGPPASTAFADPVFAKDPEIYAADRPWPPKQVSVSPAGRSRDVNYYIVEVAAGQYNPARKSLTLYDRVDVKLSFTGGTGNFVTEGMTSPFESRPDLYTGAAINGSAIAKFVGRRPILELAQGEEFMILTHPDFRAAADTLAAWKNQKGIVTNVFEVGTGTNYTTNQAIQDLIRYEYEHRAIRPSYALLLGDAEFIPAWYIAANDPVGAGAANIGTDYPYGSFTGILPGVFPDVAMGRIPVDTLEDANVVVDKIVNYEKTPPGAGNQAFYSNASIASQFQCCRKDVDQVGTDQRTFIEASEFARDTLNGQGKTVQRIYTRTIDNGCPTCAPPVPAYTDDATPRRYYDGTELPADIAPGGGFSWNGGNADIITAWNAGRFLFIHRDHGWPGGWSNPGFDWANASALTNGALLPVVFSVNCASGLFDNETNGGALGTEVGAMYFAERLLVNPNGGAVGLLGDSLNSPSWANSALLRGFIDAIYPAAIPGFGVNKSYRRLGDILNHAKLYLFTVAGVAGTGVSWADTGDELRLWNCIGDPTLEIWTKYPYARVLPANLSVHYLKDRLQFDFPIAGAEITATQANVTHGGSTPIGRVVTQEGANTMMFFKTPNPQMPIDYAITLDDANTANISALTSTAAR
jgi:hypothetical protein